MFFYNTKLNNAVILMLIILTTNILRPPFDVNTVNTTFLSICGYCGTQTLAIAALIASTSIKNTSVDVVVNGDLRVTRFKYR